MVSKTYGQACGLARALDLVGERWTLLLVRELLLGSKRYSDLASRLDGIPSNLLGDRLRQLVAAGLVARRTLPPPAPATVYELTTQGAKLAPVVLALMEFGQSLPWTEANNAARASAAWDAVQMTAANPLDRPDNAPTLALEIHSDGNIVSIIVEGLIVSVRDGSHPEAAACLIADPITFHRLRRGSWSLDEAVTGGHARVTGDITVVQEIFRLTTPPLDPTRDSSGEDLDSGAPA